MAFEITDFFRSYVPRGEYNGLFNVARSDESDDTTRYYAYYNDTGSYIIQRIVATAGVTVYTYYAKGRSAATLATDWANRTSLSYVEYYLIFHQGD